MRYVEARIREKQEAARHDARRRAGGVRRRAGCRRDLLPGLDAQFQTLGGRLAKNSSNSSKPPSTDIVKPKTKKRGKGKRKIGAQPGDAPSTDLWKTRNPQPAAGSAHGNVKCHQTWHLKMDAQNHLQGFMQIPWKVGPDGFSDQSTSSSTTRFSMMYSRRSGVFFPM